jgi:hypothetical protein
MILFILITFGLVFGLGLIIANLEKTGVMNNWDKRRCELPVIMTARFFKPDSDSRSTSQFSNDNFDFCMKQYIGNFMTLLTAPVAAVFSKHSNLAGDALGMVDTIRKIAASMYNALLGFLDTYLRKFNASIYEISRVMQYLQMAMRRANAAVMSMLYSGITLFRGLLNTLQFVIKVILIICSIMIAIIIILFFILFPFIPLILAVLSSIVAVVLSLSTVMSPDIANQANNDKGGFCFSESTEILVIDKHGKEVNKSVKDIKIGDTLERNCGTVTAIIIMNGEDVQLYDINGIIVSGSHLVLGTDGKYKSVASDERAVKCDIKSNILYCFNTTSHNIPVYSPTNLEDTALIFRDWEEMDDNDTFGQFMWNYTVLYTLNLNNSNTAKWKAGLRKYSEIPLLGEKVGIKTINGFVDISSLKINDKILDKHGKEQRILGIVYSTINNINNVGNVGNVGGNVINDGKWNTELYELDNETWIKGESTVAKKNQDTCESESESGIMLITETGEFVLWSEIYQKEKVVRDFTEIGYKNIYKTYPLVISRLRIFKNTN